MKNKILSSINLIVTLSLIYWNYLSNTGFINEKTIGQVSSEYDSLFTPAGYAFSIWGVIFLGLVAFGIFAVYLAFSKPDKCYHVEKALPFSITANLLNGLWVYLWLTENILFSVICMLFIFLSLLGIILKLKMEVWDAPMKIIALVWWSFDFYFGWITVAMVANISSYLNSINFSMGLDETTWTIIVIGLVTLINFLLIQKRNLREVAFVAVWAFIAIAVRHWENENSLSYAAIAGALVLFIAGNIHAIKNKKTAPVVQKKWGEEI